MKEKADNYFYLLFLYKYVTIYSFFKRGVFNMNKINLRKRAISLFLASSFVVVLSSCNKDNNYENNATISFMLEEFSNDTYLDEAIENNYLNNDIIKRKEELKNYLTISEEINE